MSRSTAPSDMYIDYSCSTSVERLARDVETILRQWHVADGSDRHVSFAAAARSSTASSASASNTASRASSRANSRAPSRLASFFSSRKGSRVGDDVASIGTPAFPAEESMQYNPYDDIDNAAVNANVRPATESDGQHGGGDNNRNDNDGHSSSVRLIRSASVTLASFPLPYPLHDGDHHDMILTGSGSSGTDRIDIDLTLALWDGPPRSIGRKDFHKGERNGESDTGNGDNYDYSNNGHDGHDDDDDDDTQAASELLQPPPLPLSLLPRYDVEGGIMPPCITSDLCALLGIGQHITLTPRALSRQSPNRNMDASIWSDDAAAVLLESTIMARTKLRAVTGQVERNQSNEHDRKQTRSSRGKSNCKPVERIMDELHGASSLGSMLQSALNYAASACDCRIPVFGVWNPYNPQLWQDGAGSGHCEDSNCGEFSIPLWLAGGWANVAENEDNGGGDARSAVKHAEPLVLRGVSLPPIPTSLPMHQIPPILAGQCHSGPRTGSAWGHFTVYAIPPGVDGAEHLGTLNGLSHMLLQNGLNTNSKKSTVVVVGARHCYRWERGDFTSRDKKRKWSSSHGSRDDHGLPWRFSGLEIEQSLRDHTVLDNDTAAVMQYRRKCEIHVVRLLERAAALGQTVTNTQRHHNEADESDTQPLYPSVWGPDIDPVIAIGASATWNAVTIDRFSACEADTISTESEIGEKPIKPILTLPLKTRSSHRPTLTDLHEIESTLFSTIFNPRNVDPGAFRVGAGFDVESPCTSLSASNRCVLASLIKVSNLDDETLVGHITQRVVLEELHSWERELDKESRNPARLLMDRACVGDTTRQLYDVMDWKSMANAKRSGMEDDIERALRVALGGGSILDGGIPFPSPPVGVFRAQNVDNDAPQGCAVDLSALGSAPPGRLLSVFFTSIASLRTPCAMAAAWLAFADEIRSRWDRRESLPNMGSVAGLSSARQEYNRRRRAAEDEMDCNRASKFVTPPVGRQLGSRALCAAFLHSSEAEPDLHHCLIAQKLQIFNVCVECMIAAEAGPQMDIDLAGSPGDDYYDAVSSGADNSTGADTIQSENIVGRKGVRCPVHNVFLMKSGDQLFAPYLQRTEPMSRDEVIQRRAVLTEASSSSGDKYSVRDRLEVAHRLQKPKLSSDMQSFKAANPGACFQDFTAWYGNPDNPLDEYLEGERNALPADPSPLDSKDNLEMASEAIHFLTAIRNFWYETWEQATPCPASEQDPLFDPEVASAVSMHALETIHPAYLINQILAANLSSAGFILHSEAGNASQVPAVKEALTRLDDLTETALLDLTSDRTGGWTPKKQSDRDNNKDVGRYVSVDTVASCEAACNAIGQAEITISRTMSLLSKFPGAHGLVHDILDCEQDADATAASDDRITRSDVLEIILRQQNQLKVASEHAPLPSVQEYVIRKEDDYMPRQMTVRLGNVTGSRSGNKQGLLLALSECVRE